MNHRHALLALAIAASVLSLPACRKEPTPVPAGSVVSQAPEGETADQFVARVNDEFKKF